MDEPELICTFFLDGGLFGVPVGEVQEILRYQPVTPVPLAPREVEGLINLRGRILTALDLRRSLGMPEREPGASPSNVVIRWEEELASFLVDRIGDVLELPEASREPPPDTLDPTVRRLVRAVYKLDEGLLLLLDVEKILQIEASHIGA